MNSDDARVGGDGVGGDGRVRGDGRVGGDVPGDGGDDVELVVVTMRFDADDDALLLSVLSKYVVLTRMEPGCRNVDLVASVTHPGRHLVIEKWESSSHQRTHFDAPSMVEMATACSGLLDHAPDIDLWDPTSAHDLR